jgi:integrase
MSKKISNPALRIRIGSRVVISRRGKKGTYNADFSLRGRHVRKTLGTANLKVARQRAAEIEVQLSAGTFKSRPLRTTISDGAKMYQDNLAAENRAARTLTRYRRPLTRFTDFCRTLRVTLLSQVTLLHLDRYRAFLKKIPLSQKSIYIELVIIKQLYRWCLSRGLVAQNPIADYKVTKPVTIPKPVPTLPQVSAILQHASDRLASQIMLLVCTGMRAGELQALRKADVDLNAGFLHVRRQLHGPTKTKTQRVIPIHPSIRPLLVGLLAADDHELLLTGLPSRRYPAGGRPINTRKLLERFQAAAARAGLPRFTVHALRHTFNTTTLNAGVPLPLVQQWMGHSTRSMTEVYYDASDAASLRFMGTVPFDSATAAEAAKGDSKCVGVRLVG